jgi:CDP-glucose 4,6-dehydratase
VDSLVARLTPLKGQRVLVTGQTGFKGSWLSIWLRELGADVWGLSLPPMTNPSLYELAGLTELFPHRTVDIRDRHEVLTAVRDIEPTVVFHMAAQPIVLRSYEDPLETFDTNIVGSINVLEAIRQTESVRSLVYVTSDKCYRNDESGRPYAEMDALGGSDPYSASKAGAEIVFGSYVSSFLSRIGHLGAVSARSGNVIGGGDWSENRLIPDCVRRLTADEPVILRNPTSVRPWQHVLDPLAGYLMLAADLLVESKSREGAWNFGPDSTSFRTVNDVASRAVEAWGSGRIEALGQSTTQHEAGLLMLDSTRARTELGWHPQLDFDDTVRSTMAWHHKVANGGNALELCIADIREYTGAKHD